MNVPYVKEYDENGKCTNPIKENLISMYPNRRMRRGMDKLPNSSKVSKCSMNNPAIRRGHKYTLLKNLGKTFSSMFKGRRDSVRDEKPLAQGLKDKLNLN